MLRSISNNRDSEIPPPRILGKPVFPEMIDIPKDRVEIKKLFKKSANRGSYHAGLRQALKSDHNRRSPRNAYILLLGQTGAGKSSTINFLFENEDITLTGDRTSETSEILEFAASVPIPELGVANSEIRVIDTPGLGDVRGIENDAKFLATLHSFLANHEDLSTAIPNIVLLVARFDDNRIDGVASGFVRMLKGVKLLQDQLIDKEFSNVIICLTHFMHAKKDIRKNPQSRYDIVKRIVKDNGFPEPIIVVGAENDAIEKELEEMNGYYKLPSGECYPYNLFQRIQQLTTINDPMGEAIIRTAFTKPASLSVKEKSRTELIVDNGNQMYLRAIEQLIHDQFSVEETEVSSKLEYVWNNALNPNLRKLYPGSLNIAQNVFQIRQIRKLNELPKTSEETVKLLKEIPQNEGILTLLEKALGITVPDISIPLLVGNGYNVLQDISVFSPFLLTNYKPSPLGYKIPHGIRCELVNETDDVCVVTQTAQECATRRLTDLNMPSALVPSMSEAMEVRSGYNVLQQMGKKNFTTLREHRTFHLAMDPDVKLSRAFLDDIQALPPFSEQIHIKHIWKTFFDKYGTHVVTSAYGGGSIETHLEEQDMNKLVESNGGDLQKAVQRLTYFDREIEAGDLVGSSVENYSREMASAVTFGVKFRGGSMRYHKSNLSQIDKDEAAATLENWRQSLATEPIMLETKLKLVPLSYYLKPISQKLAGEVDKACESLFSTPFQYVPEKEKDPPRRMDILSPKNMLDKSSCLKAGTEILMADGTTKPVEHLVAGDMILDKDLKPSAVIGCNYFFLGARSFYGFSSESQFFTEVHIFVGPGMVFRVASKQDLLEENPCFEQFGKVENMDGDFEIMQVNWENHSVSPSQCHLYEDPMVYPADTPVYFLEVDNASGTYFANGFLCRHELPPFHLWPKTFDCLQKMMFVPEALLKISQMPFTPNSLQEFKMVAESIAESLEEGFQSGKLVCNNSQIQDLNDIRKNLSAVLSQKCLAAFGLVLYGKCGKILYKNLDKQGKLVRMDLLRDIVQGKIEEYLDIILAN